MTQESHIKADPNLDLVLEREIDVPPELVWEVWTKPEHLKEWFAPKPWQIVECEVDLRPGGAVSIRHEVAGGRTLPKHRLLFGSDAAAPPRVD